MTTKFDRVDEAARRQVSWGGPGSSFAIDAQDWLDLRARIGVLEAALRRCVEVLTVMEGGSELMESEKPVLFAARVVLAASPEVKPTGEGERVPPVSCRACGEGQATTWVYSRHGVGYAVCGECDTSSITGAAPGPMLTPSPVQSTKEGAPRPAEEACPHLRVGTRDGRPWTCRDCGAVRVNGEWSAAPADARLIAAAPELLDALRFIHEHAFEAKWSGDERGLGLVEAAIAKAEGRAP